MPFCKKIKAFIYFCLLAIGVQSAIAGDSSMHIRSAELAVLDEFYVLNADVEMKFSHKIEEAISKGFVLPFLVEFQLSKPRKYWFDDEVITVSHELTLSYHALSRQFLVTRGEQQKAFVRLDEALDDLTDISLLKVFKKAEVEQEDTLKAALLMRLDTKKLPQALQADEEWHMRSQRLEWVPNLANKPAKMESNPDVKPGTKPEAKPEIKLEPVK